MSQSEPAQCPFKVGDVVVYRPTVRGRYLAHDVMKPYNEQLQPGMAYKIVAITRGAYVTVEGYSHAAGGLHWTEFAAR